MNLPNKITLGRLALVFVLLALLSFTGQIVLNIALLVFIVASATDWLDGYLARKYNMTTEFGRAADPFVDKVVVLGALIFLIKMPGSHVMPWMVALILMRELLVTGLRAIAESRGVAFAADAIGKVKTVFQLIAIGVEIFSIANDGHIDWLYNLGWGYLRYAMLYAAVILTILSGVEYVVRAKKMFLHDTDA